MTHETRNTPHGLDEPDAVQRDAPSALGRLVLQGVWFRLCQWGETISDLLTRAEKQIQEKFRVPPNGG